MIVTNQPTQSGAQSNRPISKLLTLGPRSGPSPDDCVIVSLVKCVNRMQLQTLWNVTEIPFLVQSRSESASMHLYRPESRGKLKFLSLNSFQFLVGTQFSLLESLQQQIATMMVSAHGNH